MIIKPKVNPDGSQVIDFAKKGDWYFNTYRFLEWSFAISSIDKVPIYYAEEWRPKVENERYWNYSFHPLCSNISDSNLFLNSKADQSRILFGNCFQTQAEAEDVNNILKVLRNMEKYYEDKLKGEKENGKN